MIYDTWKQIQQHDLDIKIFDFLPILCVMNCKEVCSFFTRDRSFTKFYGLLVDRPSPEDHEKLKDLFKKRSYVRIDLSVFCRTGTIQVQELLDFLVSDCCTERLRFIDLTLCCHVERLPAFPNIELAYYTEDFDVVVPSFCASCIWCKSMRIRMTGCFQMFTADLYPLLSPSAVTVIFFTSAFYVAIRAMKSSRKELPFLLMDPVQPFPRKITGICLDTVYKMTEEEQANGNVHVSFAKYTVVLARKRDPVTRNLVWKITSFFKTKTRRVLSV